MLENISALLFDLDGTLVDSMGIWKEIDIEYLGQYNIALPDDLQKCLEGMCFFDTAVYIKERFGIEDDVENIMNTWNKMAEYKYSHSVFLKDGAIKLLKTAKINNIKTAIATSNSRILCNAVINALNIGKYFDYILTGCDSLKSKPDPEVYLTAASKLNVSKESCLVFEDIIPGILSGKNAGMKVCVVEDKYSHATYEEKMRLADYYIKDYNDIVYPECWASFE